MVKYTKERQALSAELLEDFGINQIMAGACRLLFNTKLAKGEIDESATIEPSKEEIAAFIETLDADGMRTLRDILDALPAPQIDRIH